MQYSCFRFLAFSSSPFTISISLILLIFSINESSDECATSAFSFLLSEIRFALSLVFVNFRISFFVFATKRKALSVIKRISLRSFNSFSLRRYGAEVVFTCFVSKGHSCLALFCAISWGFCISAVSAFSVGCNSSFGSTPVSARALPVSPAVIFILYTVIVLSVLSLSDEKYAVSPFLLGMNRMSSNGEFTPTPRFSGSVHASFALSYFDTKISYPPRELCPFEQKYRVVPLSVSTG